MGKGKGNNYPERVPHKNGLELKNLQEIHNTISPLIHACTKNGFILASSLPPYLKE